MSIPHIAVSGYGTVLFILIFLFCYFNVRLLTKNILATSLEF